MQDTELFTLALGYRGSSSGSMFGLGLCAAVVSHSRLRDSPWLDFIQQLGVLDPVCTLLLLRVYAAGRALDT